MLPTFSLNKEIDYDVINLRPVTEKGWEHLGKVWAGVEAGRITECVNPDAYATGVEEKLKLRETNSKEVPLITENELAMGYTGEVLSRLSENDIATQCRRENEIDTCTAQISLANELDQLEQAHILVYLDTHQNLAQIILSAGTTDGKARLDELFERYTGLKDLLWSIMTTKSTWRDYLTELRTLHITSDM